jgi:hypothetical protein
LRLSDSSLRSSSCFPASYIGIEGYAVTGKKPLSE